MLESIRFSFCVDGAKAACNFPSRRSRRRKTLFRYRIEAARALNLIFFSSLPENLSVSSRRRRRHHPQPRVGLPGEQHQRDEAGQLSGVGRIRREKVEEGRGEPAAFSPFLSLSLSSRRFARRESVGEQLALNSIVLSRFFLSSSSSSWSREF